MTLYSRRMWTPLWLAFTTTAASIVYVVAGASGYILSRREAFRLGTHWVDEVIWPQVWAGLGIGAVSLWFWRRGLRSARPRT